MSLLLSILHFFQNLKRHGGLMEEGLEPKRTISLSWDDPWNKYEDAGRKIPEERAEHYPIQTFPGQRNHDLKNPNSSLRNNSRNGGNR